jgi:uncharacterized protein YjiS (DUF1127 family)
MSCSSATCSPTISFAVPAPAVPAFARARMAAFAMPWLQFPHAALDTIARWKARRAGRLALLELDDHLLADIGVTREQMLRETRKPFWR